MSPIVHEFFGFATFRSSTENNKHSLLRCHLFEKMRNDLLGQISNIPGIDIVSIDSNSLWKLLLFGSTNLFFVVNRIILDTTIAYIKATKRSG